MTSSLSLHVRMIDGREGGRVLEMDREIALDLINSGRAVLPNAVSEIPNPQVLDAEVQNASEKPPGGPQPVLAAETPPAPLTPLETPAKGLAGRFRRGSPR